VSCDAARADGRAFNLRAMNRMFSFATFFTAHATLCVIRYDHLAIKLGPDVQKWKFNHRLWTSISDARICKQCSVNQTSYHIPTVYSHFSLIFPRFLACGLQCALRRIHTMRRRIGDRSAGGSVPIPSQLDRARTRFTTKIGSITNMHQRILLPKMLKCIFRQKMLKNMWSNFATFHDLTELILNEDLKQRFAAYINSDVTDDLCALLAVLAVFDIMPPKYFCY